MSIAIKELVRRPGRFVPVGGALTLLVVLLVVLGGFLDGLELSQTGPYRAHEGRLLVYSDDSDLLIQRSRLDADTARQLEATSGVAAVGRLNLISSTAVDDRGEIIDIVLLGYDLATAVLPAPPNQGGAVLDAAATDFFDVKVGDTLLVGPSSEPVVVSRIVPDLSLGSPTMWLGTERWRQVVRSGNPAALPPAGVSEALVVEPGPDAGQQELAAELRMIGGIDVATSDQAIDALPVVQQQSSTFAGIIGVTFVVTLLVVALFFALITLERSDLYAVLKALGARSGGLLAGVSAQAVGVSVVALAVGFALSVVFAASLPAELPVRLVPARMLQTAAGVLVTALLGSAFTLRRITRIDPAEAIG